MRILVAEDDATIRQLMFTLLSRTGIDCVTVENGRSAVDAWERESFDFVVMDVQMPVMDGLAATRLIREKEMSRGGHTPIIAITAHAMAEDKELCFAAGMDDYISKPIDVERLFALLAKDYPTVPR
jgi:CheY-like chemotaxis protein